VKELGSLLNEHEIVLNEALLDEGKLVQRHDILYPSCKPRSQYLGHQLSEAMNEADGPIVLDP
jgi:hypothetical protein